MTGNRLRPGEPRRPRPVSWALVVGLGTLVLLWPLAELTGVPAAIGQLATAALVLGAVALLWICGAGLWRVPRPVLTLTLAGAVSGVLLVVVSLTLGLRALPTRSVVNVIGTVLGATALGGLSGVGALALQRARSSR